MRPPVIVSSSFAFAISHFNVTPHSEGFDFSRYVVGWLVAEKESAALAKRLIAESCASQNIEPGQLIIHADRRQRHAIEDAGADDGRPGRHEEPLPAARFRRQPRSPRRSSRR